MKKIVIIGASGHAKVVADIIFARKKDLNEEIEIIAFLDDNYKKLKYKKLYTKLIYNYIYKLSPFWKVNECSLLDIWRTNC